MFLLISCLSAARPEGGWDIGGISPFGRIAGSRCMKQATYAARAIDGHIHIRELFSVFGGETICEFSSVRHLSRHKVAMKEA